MTLKSEPSLKSDIAVVLPTNRVHQAKQWYDAWATQLVGVRLIVVEDGPKQSFRLNAEYDHYCWEDIDKDLGDDKWIISKRDSGIRAYGFIKAWEGGAQHILTFDDDVFPLGMPVAEHICNLGSTGEDMAWEYTADVPTRGFPYRNLYRRQPIVISHGLWKGVLDQDAPHQLVNPENSTGFDFRQTLPRGMYYPMCGMNLGFSRAILPAMYFPRMGEGVEYRRFDDIWAGLISKKVCDHLGLAVSNGQPLVDHRRASDPFENLIKEAPGIKANEGLWQFIDEIVLTRDTVQGCCWQIGEHFSSQHEESYFREMGEAIIKWLTILDRRDTFKRRGKASKR